MMDDMVVINMVMIDMMVVDTMVVDTIDDHVRFGMYHQSDFDRQSGKTSF